MLGFLFSFWYCRKINMDRLLRPLDPMPPLFADSGAFTAHNKMATISVDDYASWIEKWDGTFDYYANLDVKGNVAAGLRNLEILEARGLRPIPVFHGGEPWSVLDDFCKEYEYVALGGISGAAMQSSNPKVQGWLDRCFNIAGDTKLHGFGMTNWSVVRRFPWHSIDSASIGAGYRYGQVSTYDPYTKRWLKWPVKDKRHWGKNGWLVREYGLTPMDFAQPRTRACTQAIMHLATRSMAKAIEDIPETQMYVVDDGGSQAGLRRVHVFNAANQRLVH